MGMAKHRQHTIVPADVERALHLKGPLARLVCSILKVNPIIEINNRYGNLPQDQFMTHALEDLGISYELDARQLAHIPATGGFITVSNHPTGMAEGVILKAVLGRVRPDFKTLSTTMLNLFPGLDASSIPVNNLDAKPGAQNLSSIRNALAHLANGGGLGLFASGEVSSWQKGHKKTALGKRVIEDRPWEDSVTKLIRHAKVPVVPIWFEGHNSRLFHILGQIHPRLRTIRLVPELVGQRGNCFRMIIGQPIPPHQFESFDIPSLGRYLRSRCYALEALAQPLPAAEAPSGVPVAAAEDPALVREEMARIPERLLFASGDYRCYLTPAADMPHTIKELARLREITFRAIGEGSGNPYDTDSYDNDYLHMIIWHAAHERIVGAYRLGICSELLAAKGVAGIYSASEVRYTPESQAILPQCMELGRSFIVKDYQRDVLPLKFLFTGLLCAAAKFPQVKYFLGLVSISNSIPPFYKSLIVRFLEQTARQEGAPLAVPDTPFQPDYLRVNPDQLIGHLYSGGATHIDQLDQLLGALSSGAYRIPVLVRKYFSLNAKLLCFNVDPLFNYCLDGLVLMQLSDLPKGSVRSFTRDLPPELREAINQAIS